MPPYSRWPRSRPQRWNCRGRPGRSPVRPAPRPCRHPPVRAAPQLLPPHRPRSRGRRAGHRCIVKRRRGSQPIRACADRTASKHSGRAVLVRAPGRRRDPRRRRSERARRAAAGYAQPDPLRERSPGAPALQGTAGAHPGDRSVGQLAAHLERPRTQRRRHDGRPHRAAHARARRDVAALELHLTRVQQRAEHRQLLAQVREWRLESSAERTFHARDVCGSDAQAKPSWSARCSITSSRSRCPPPRARPSSRRCPTGSSAARPRCPSVLRTGHLDSHRRWLRGTGEIAEHGESEAARVSAYALLAKYIGISDKHDHLSYRCSSLRD